MNTRRALLLACLTTATSAQQLTTLKFVGAKKVSAALDNSTHYEGTLFFVLPRYLMVFVFGQHFRLKEM